MSNQKIKVLLVEDVTIAQVMAKLLLEQINCEVDTAETGKQALELLEKKIYQFIFMDIGLPDISGIEVAKQIKQKKSLNQNTSIVALTANIDDIVKKHCMEVGIRDVLAKPLLKEDCKRLFGAINS